METDKQSALLIRVVGQKGGVEMGPKELQEHIFATYTNLRIGIAVTAILFPFLLLFGGLRHGITWQNSMSAYYHATVGAASPPMRAWFVGLLLTLGAFLFLYKGFSKEENWCLNLAGFFAWCVAFFPMPWPEETGFSISTHYVCAVLLFICVGIVTLFCTKQTLELVKNPSYREWFKTGYRITGSAMVLLPILIVLYKELFPELAKPFHPIFWLEAVCICAFASYWIIKSLELRKTTAEIDALQQKISTEPSNTTPPPGLVKPAFLTPIVTRIQRFRRNLLPPARYI
jgi:hypothetical protein